MYLISVYFDTSSNKRLQHIIDQIAKETGNDFMLAHQVPPHLTISAFETREPRNLLESFCAFAGELKPGTVSLASPGVLLPYVLYVAPVLNEYLMGVQQAAFSYLETQPDVKVNRFYKPYQWLPHITLGKTLTEEQMKTAFAVVQKHFTPFEAGIEQIGLAKTNPHEDLVILQQGDVSFVPILNNEQ